MNCAEVERNEYIERYLQGELEEEKTRELEEHYVSCDQCFHALEEHSILRTALSEKPWAVQEQQVSSPRQWRWGWTGAWVGSAAVALVVVALGVWLFSSQPRAQLDAQVAELSAIEPPPYVPRTFRSPEGETNRLFREAMIFYGESDWTGAISRLEKVVESEPRSGKGLFYLGACYLLADEPKSAIGSLGRLLDLGPSPYLERAHFYRAKAFLRVGDLDQARAELNEVIGFDGEMKTKAAELLDMLPR